MPTYIGPEQPEARDRCEGACSATHLLKVTSNNSYTLRNCKVVYVFATSTKPTTIIGHDPGVPPHAKGKINKIIVQSAMLHGMETVP